MNADITNINNENKYYSYLIAQTESKQIAEKWEYYVLSCQGQLLMNTQQSKSEKKYQYNLSADTVSYEISNGRNKLILAQGNWINPCLTKTQLSLLNSSKILQYDKLSIYKIIRFYYYVKNKFPNQQTHAAQKYKQITQSQNKQQMIKFAQQNANLHGGHFIQIQLKYILRNDCLIFELNNQSQIKSNVKILQMQDFKQINVQKPKNIKNIWQFTIYNFKSQYALLSDQHFLNCLVKGKKSIGSYLKIGGNYQFIIDEQIAQILNSIYIKPKL